MAHVSTPRLFALGLVAATLAAASPAVARDEAFEEEARAEIAATSPEAADLFVRATAEREAGHWKEARALFVKALELAPASDHLHRRLCNVEAHNGNLDAAVSACVEAIRLRDDALNHAAYADALVTATTGSQRPMNVIGAAQREAASALASANGDPVIFQMVAFVGLRLDDEGLARRATKALAATPNPSVETLLVDAELAAMLGDFGAARAWVRKAKLAGADPEVIAKATALLAEMEESSSSPLGRWALRFGAAVATVLGALALVLFLASRLSKRTLEIAAQLPAEADGRVHGVTASLRRSYSWLIGAAATLFFASLPLVPVVVLAAAATLVYAFIQLGRIPVQLTFFVVVGAVVTVWATLKGAFAAFKGRSKNEDAPLDLDRHPAFRTALREAAAHVGTRPVDKVFLETGTVIAVTEEGSLRERLRGRGERHLHLGVGVLDGMTVRELKAILAHEYGHFRNEDTAGGDVALAVRSAVLEMATTMVRGRAASLYNPGWHFVQGFHAAFTRVSFGASRLQEILADRAAIHAYGSRAFASGLRHVIARTLTFEAQSSAALEQAIKQKQALPNLYQHALLSEAPSKAVEASIRLRLHQNTDHWDSHPAPKDRIAWADAAAFAGVCPSAEAETEPAWALFSNRNAIETAQTALIRQRIAIQHGVRIAG